MKIETRNHFLYTLSVNFKLKLFLPQLFFLPPHEWSGLMGVAASLAARGHNKQIAKTKQNVSYRQCCHSWGFLTRSGVFGTRLGSGDFFRNLHYSDFFGLRCILIFYSVFLI